MKGKFLTDKEILRLIVYAADIASQSVIETVVFFNTRAQARLYFDQVDKNKELQLQAYLYKEIRGNQQMIGDVVNLFNRQDIYNYIHCGVTPKYCRNGVKIPTPEYHFA